MFYVRSLKSTLVRLGPPVRMYELFNLPNSVVLNGFMFSLLATRTRFGPLFTNLTAAKLKDLARVCVGQNIKVDSDKGVSESVWG